MHRKIKINTFLIFVFSFFMIVGQYFDSVVSQVMALISIGYTIIYFKKRIIRVNGTEFGKYLLLFALLICFGILNSYYRFNEDIFFNFRRVLVIIASILLYFVGADSISKGKITSVELRKIIIAIGVLALMLFVLQYVLYDQIQFLDVHTGIRKGSTRIRFYYNCILLILPLFLCFDIFLKKRNLYRYICIIFAIGVMFEVYIIQNYRMSTISVVITIACGYFLYSRSYKKLIVFIAIVIGSLIFVYTSNELREIWQSFVNGTDTFAVRAQALTYYSEKLKDSLLFGYGTVFPAEILSTAALAAGYGQWIQLGDNGILGFAYCYGILGILWFICFWIVLYKKGIYLFKSSKTRIMYGLLFPLYMTIVLRSEILWYWNNGFVVFVLYLLLLESDIYNLKNLKNESKLARFKTG